MSKKEYYGTVEEAVAVINNWSQMYTLLWAWIEIVEGRAKLNRITLKKAGEGWEAPTTRP